MLMSIKRVIKCGWVVIEGRARKIFPWKIEEEICLSSKWRICEIMSSSQPNANVAWICTIYKHQNIHLSRKFWRAAWSMESFSSLCVAAPGMEHSDEASECWGQTAWVSTLLLWLTPWWRGMLSIVSELQLSVCITKCGSVIKKSKHVHVYE